MSQSSFVGYKYPATKHTHTMMPGGAVPVGYFDEQNILFIQSKIAEVLKRKFIQHIAIDRGSIVRIMGRVLDERIETIPKMNQRVIMYCCNDYIIHQLEVDRNLKLEAHFVIGDRIYDPTTERVKFDPQMVKLANRLGTPRIAGAGNITSRFYFT